jgi:hypothetical protein
VTTQVIAFFVAASSVGLGSIIESTGRPGAVAVAHLFYGWGIIYAICFGQWIGKE